MDERKKKLIEVVLDLFMEQGPLFKMDDVAKAMKMSKKTIYKEFGNKEDIICLGVEAIFEGIEHKLQEIMEDETIDTVEKLIRITCAFPDSKDIDYHKVIMLKDSFFGAYEMFIDYIENNWQLNNQVFLRAVSEGYFKDIDYSIYRMITIGLTKQILDTDCENKEELLEKCVRQTVSGFLK